MAHRTSRTPEAGKINRSGAPAYREFCLGAIVGATRKCCFKLVLLRCPLSSEPEDKAASEADRGNTSKLSLSDALPITLQKPRGASRLGHWDTKSLMGWVKSGRLLKSSSRKKKKSHALVSFIRACMCVCHVLSAEKISCLYSHVPKECGVPTEAGQSHRAHICRSRRRCVRRRPRQQRVTPNAS